MTRPIVRFLLVACCVILQLYSVANAKEPKLKQKDVGGLTYLAFPDGLKPGEELLANIVQQMHWDNAGAGNLDRMAVHLRFEQVGEVKTPQGNLPRYRVLAEGAPENKVYGLSTWVVGKIIDNSDQDVYVNAQGLVMTRRPNPNEEGESALPGIELYVTPTTTPGEPTRYGVASRDRDVTALGTIVPNPVVNLDRLCRLEARIAAPGASAVLVVADGFNAHTRLSFILESLGEVENVEVTTDQNGHAVMAGFPFINGKTQGVLKASAQGQNCLPSVQIPWDATPAVPATPTAPAASASPAPATAGKPK